MLLCTYIIRDLLMSFDFAAWVKRSTKESGVSLKVQDTMAIAKLRLLVTRPTQPSRAQGRTASVPRRAHRQAGQDGSPRASRAA